ncbi:MAG TPA: holo-ACP synthase [Candidatus Onthovicinus excrementipullorum]|nr:holo-ACP synthase [Candidatus Onthovicinus excrementipullorum]
MIRCGIDLLDIARIEDLIRKRRFLERVFGPQELEQLKRRGMPAQSAAGNFAAKEAFLKLFERGIFSVPLREIEVLRRESGAPYYRLSGAAADLAENVEIALSITHTDTQAAAFAVATGEEF